MGFLLLLLVGAAAVYAIAESGSGSTSSNDPNSKARFASAAMQLLADGPNVGRIDPSGITPEQRAAIEDAGRKAQADWERQKQAFIDRAKTYGEAFGGDTGGSFMETLGKISVALGGGGPSKWFSDAEFARANTDVIDMIKDGLRPLPFDGDLYGGFSGWADDMDAKLAAFANLAPDIQSQWIAFSAWLYQHSDIADAIGFPWDIFSLIRNDKQLDAFGRTYAKFLGADETLQAEYGARAQRIGRWLRTTEPYRFETAASYTPSLMILLDNVDKPGF